MIKIEATIAKENISNAVVQNDIPNPLNNQVHLFIKYMPPIRRSIFRYLKVND